MLSIKNTLLIALYINYVSCNGCEKISPCTFKYPSGIIDLNEMKATSGIFTAYTTKEFGIFSHPCQDVPFAGSTESGVIWYFKPSVVSNVTLNPLAVLNGSIPGTPMVLASSKEVECKAVENSRVRNSVLYTHDGITTEVLFVCDDTEPSKLLSGVSLSVTHSLELRGLEACPKIESRNLSGGSIFVIIFFTFSFIYLIGGALTLKYLRGAQGLEMIPNLEFWQELPSLVKEGVLFVCCRGRTAERAYDQI